MKEETRERVLKAAAEIGYVPNALAQQFARRRSGNIGVILPFVPKVHLFSTYYFSEILSGIGEAAKQKGYNLLLIFREPDEPRDYAKLFRTQKIDACIMLGAQNVADELQELQELQAEGYPFCLVNQRFDEQPFYSVDADHLAGSMEAVRHLIGQGCRAIGFINGPPQYSNSTDRMLGYRSALQEHQIAYEEKRVFVGNYSRKSGYALAEAVAQRIRSGSMDAVFAANDRMAIGLMHGLKEEGLEAGKHYAIVGYDDSDGSRIISPRLTTVSVPFYEMGRTAALHLLDQKGERQMKPQMLPVSLIPRESSIRK